MDEENPTAGVKTPDIFDIFGLGDTADVGKEFELAPNAFLSLRYASPTQGAYSAVAEKELRPHRSAIEADLMTNKDVTPILVRIFSLAVATGWRGSAWVHPETRRPLPFSQANFELVMNKAPVLFERARKLAEDFKNFRNEIGDPEVDVKN